MPEIFWDILGIPATTDTSKIRKAYSKLVKEHGPEDDEEGFKKINGAYKAACKFAANFERLGVSDEQIVITDKRPDGSFGVKFLDKDGKPLYPTPPSTLPELDPRFAGNKTAEPQYVEDREFDFESIDSSVIKDYSFEEVSERAGMISFATGFAVPDSPKTRKIKKFLDDNKIILDLSKRVMPGEEKDGRGNGLRIAKLILDSEFIDQKVIWQFFFTSPLVISLRTDLEFYRMLENVINARKLPVNQLIAIAEGSGMRPRIYTNPSKAAESIKEPQKAIDFVSRVPFRYEKGKYPKLDEIMKREKPEAYKELTDFLSTIPINLYGILMPVVVPWHKEALQEAIYAFNYIVRTPQCRKMSEKRILWKMFVQGTLVRRPLVYKEDFLAALTKQTLDFDIPKEVLVAFKKEIGKFQYASLKRKEGSDDQYYLNIHASKQTMGKGEYRRAMSKSEAWGTTIGMILMTLFVIVSVCFYEMYLNGFI